MMNLYFVYILTNAGHTVLYTGVTNNLKIRVYQHREKTLPGFTTGTMSASSFTTRPLRMSLP